MMYQLEDRPIFQVDHENSGPPPDLENGGELKGSIDPMTGTADWNRQSLSIQSSCLWRTNRKNEYFDEPFGEPSTSNDYTQRDFGNPRESEKLVTEFESLLGEWHTTKDLEPRQPIDQVSESNADPGPPTFPAMLGAIYDYETPTSARENDDRISEPRGEDVPYGINWFESGIPQVYDGDSLFGYLEQSPVSNGWYSEVVLPVGLPQPDTAATTAGKSDVSQSRGRKRKAADDDKGFETPKEDSSGMIPFRDDDGRWRTPCSCRETGEKLSWGRMQDAKRHLREDGPHVAKRRCEFGCGRVFNTSRKSVMKKHRTRCPAFLRRKGMDVSPEDSRRKQNSEGSGSSPYQRRA